MVREGPRIYNLFPTIVGPVAAWHDELPRIAEMAFDWIFLNPFHEPGFSGSLYAVKDYFRLNPLLIGSSKEPPDRLLADFILAAEEHGLRVMMDLVINHTAKDSPLVDQHPGWFVRDEAGGVVSPFAVDPDDESKVTVWGDLAEINYSERPERDEIVAYWDDVVAHYARIGFSGFRCDAAYKVPAEVWKPIIETARAERPGTMFVAETLGCRLEEVAALAPAGFDYLLNSSKWWDFEAPWLLEQYEAFRHIAPSISFPESHDTPRLAEDLARNGVRDEAEIEAAYRQRYLFSALFSTGVMMPIGYEYGWQRKPDVVKTRPEDREPKRFDLSGFIAEVNRMKSVQPIFNDELHQEYLGEIVDGVVALLREQDDASCWTITLINRLPSQAVVASPRGIAGQLDGTVEITPGSARRVTWDDQPLTLKPFDVRVFAGKKEHARPGGQTRRGSRPTSRPVVIQNVYPELDCGRYPVKRVVGDTLAVWADIFREGHGRLAAVLKIRTEDESGWTERPMTRVEPGLDRWSGYFDLARNTRYRYTIEAWPDAYETWREDMEKKRNAGQSVALDLAEGRAIVADATRCTDDESRDLIEKTLRDFDKLDDEAERVELLTSDLVRGILAKFPDREHAVGYDHELEVVVDRERGLYGAWYEMVPRSQGTEPGRSATFKDCERRLPEIKAMGFDVVYLPPIHPIGRTNRKGPNNTLNADASAPGSLYAIGSEEGGHTAVHPELGTLQDFRRFVRAANSHGMEIALDFAVQCSPDHPWIKEHPEWFIFRPDGTIKFAENPPKKYEDIVNVNFYGPHHDALARALRDVILFWVDQGVKIFRVDNPHTKPIPFWEWMIREVQADHPDVIFLSEAFTRPRVLEMLAKAGFTQSYTYFTWRDTKHDLTNYLTELTRTFAKEYLRPNFFTNTPDILPHFLQTGGRPAFVIRFVLAATLSTSYGIYNGFELCEATAVPGSEEYLDSEKYDYKVWDWDRPGNIKDVIARVNAIRRENPALRRFDNLAFLPASDDAVLFYSKTTADGANAVFVAVNLDPKAVHESEIELPLAALGIGEDHTFEVEELLSGLAFSWRGSRQVLRLDPESNPAVILRITPPSAAAPPQAGA